MTEFWRSGEDLNKDIARQQPPLFVELVLIIDIPRSAALFVVRRLNWKLVPQLIVEARGLFA